MYNKAHLLKPNVKIKCKSHDKKHNCNTKSAEDKQGGKENLASFTNVLESKEISEK
jgi:hypothetical protein